MVILSLNSTLVILLPLVYITFTSLPFFKFHSGYITTGIIVLISIRMKPLNSTLVILLPGAEKIFMDEYSFKFHSGYITTVMQETLSELIYL